VWPYIWWYPCQNTIYHIGCLWSLLVLNRASVPAGLMREGQKYQQNCTFWGCVKVRDSNKYLWNLGCRMSTVRYSTHRTCMVLANPSAGQYFVMEAVQEWSYTVKLSETFPQQAGFVKHAHTHASGKGWPEPYTYGVYMVFLAGESRNIRSYYMTHIRCIYTVLTNPTLSGLWLAWVCYPGKIEALGDACK
jgi:hypothetical protein